VPRNSKLLPYLQIKGKAQLKYVRRVPPDLQKYLGGRRYITRILETDSIDPKDRRVIKAWSQINQEVEAELAEAKQLFDARPEPVERLSPRDAAGIAAEPFRQLLNALETGRSTDKQEELAVQTGIKTITALLRELQEPENALQIRQETRSQISEMWLEDVLSQLRIDPTPEVLEQIKARYSQYAQMAVEDQKRLSDGDFSQSSVETKAPPLPVRQVEWQELVDAWIAELGGIRQVSGVGIGEKQVEAHQRNIAELIKVLQLHFPAEITVADVRKYLKYLQGSELATSTKQQRLGTFVLLFEIGTRIGLLEVNPFLGITIKEPRAESRANYRPFTNDELVTIFKKQNQMVRRNEHSILPLTLLMTGARASEILFLRHSDIAQTEDGVWYFKMVDRPTDKYPRTLKGNKADERFTPMHPLLIDRGFLDLVDTDEEGYVFENRSNAALSCYFKRILKTTGIYEHRKTVVHSLRGTAIDAWRKARIPEDARRALTAHSSRDVQERTYGKNLQFMPDVLYKELCKVDWSWIP